MRKGALSVNLYPSDLEGRMQVWIHGKERFESEEEFMEAIKSGNYVNEGYTVSISIGFREIKVTSWIDGEKFDKVVKKTLKY